MDKTKKRLNKLIVTIALMLLSLLMMQNISNASLAEVLTHSYVNANRSWLDPGRPIPFSNHYYEIDSFAASSDEFAGIDLMNQTRVKLGSSEFKSYYSPSERLNVSSKNRACFYKSTVSTTGDIPYSVEEIINFNAPKSAVSSNGSQLTDQIPIMAYITYVGHVSNKRNTYLYGTAGSASAFQETFWHWVPHWYWSQGDKLT